MQNSDQSQHVFIVGAKCLGAYGGYETFVYQLTGHHRHNSAIKYHILCKANGIGSGDENRLPGVVHCSDSEFECNNAHCIKIPVPNIGQAQAIAYDCLALSWCCKYIASHHVEHPIIYILACRIGPFIKHYYKRIHALGGRIYLNPDGHEWLRSKWPAPVRHYWRFSERQMVVWSDLVVCDSINIEKYIKETYQEIVTHKGRRLHTMYIAYGADLEPSTLSDADEHLQSWYQTHHLSSGRYDLIVGRFVPENSYEVMIREFMQSHTTRDLAIVTGPNDAFKRELERRLQFSQDPRIKFVGTVYDQQLLKKIRENAYAYLHGHTVGGTNPSLIEALSSTKINLLVNVGFNEEVAGDSALYWTREQGDLATLIDRIDTMSEAEIEEMSNKAKTRVAERYTWERICGEYESLFSEQT